MHKKPLHFLIAVLLLNVLDFVNGFLLHNSRRQHASFVRPALPMMDQPSGLLNDVISTARSMPSWTTHMQAVGETWLAVLVAVAALQGAMVVKQYENNPLGEMIVPPGLTVGVEDASSDDDSSPTTSAASLRNTSLMLNACHSINAMCSPDDSDVIFAAKKTLFRANRFLLLLAPFLAAQWGMTILEFGHIFHMTCILGLAHIYDFFKSLPEPEVPDTAEPPVFGDTPHVVVLGDSMSVGIGSVNEFDPEKNSGIQYRIEHPEPRPEDDTETLSNGPVFPRVLARSLSEKVGKPVSWRSAGVDGGDTQAIQEHLLAIIQEEVEKGKAPDAVVILTGSNDLKHILSLDPKNSASIRGFRSNLMELAKRIRDISPRSHVFLPALPTYKLDKDSILNVFPLSFFLDGIIGVWDAQKIEAAKQSNGVHYVDLTIQDVRQWYDQERRQNHGQPVSLIALDGIHPSAQSYARWAHHVSKAVCETFVVGCRRQEESAMKASSTLQEEKWDEARAW